MELTREGADRGAANTMATAQAAAPQVESQAQIQARLSALHLENDLAAALDALREWCSTSGYLPHNWEALDEWLTVPMPWRGVPLRLQLNRSRERYGVTGAGLPAGAACPICIENVGAPGRELLRVYEFELAGRAFFIQHTPFPFAPGHFVLIQREHAPMEMNGKSVTDLWRFLELAPGYVACSNSDIAWAGASILAHHHYQVFRQLALPVSDCPPANGLVSRVGGTVLEMLEYPAAVLRLTGRPELVLAMSDRVIGMWKSTAPGRATVNLIAQARGEKLELHIIFRHSAHRTPTECLPFKQEGVGVLEMGGMIILPRPGGADAMERTQRIREDAGWICNGILRGNSPVEAGPARMELYLKCLRWCGF